MRIVVLVFVLAIANPGGVAFSAEPEIIKKWEFHSAADAAGWVATHEVAQLQVSGDALRMSLTGPDAYIHGPEIQTPLDGLLVRIHLRGDHDGTTEVYWRTTQMREFAASEAARQPTSLTPAGQFQTLEFHIGKPEDIGKTLAQIRIDPFNGNTEGMVEIKSVELLSLPSVLEVRVSFDAPLIDLSQSVKQLVTIRQLDGRAFREPLRVFTPGEKAKPIAILMPSTQPAVIRTMQFETAGVHETAVRVENAQGQEIALGTSHVIVGKDDRLPLVAGLRSDRTRLDFLRVAEQSDKDVWGARWQIRDAGGAWRQCGWLLPLYHVVEQPMQGPATISESLFGQIGKQSPRHVAVDMRGDTHDARVTFDLIERAGREAIEVRAELTRSPAVLFDFSGPTVLCTRERKRDPLDRYALFGGIEFLEPGWPSSGERGIGKWLAARWSPAPYKIAMPVMAVEAGGVTTSIMWDPGQECAPGESMPASTFASPNFLDGQADHLMELSTPGDPKIRRENSSYAQSAARPATGAKRQLTFLLYAEPDLPVAIMAQRYYEIFPPPPVTPAPHDDAETYNLIARNYGETTYQSGKGWTMHWFMGEAHRHIPTVAGELVAHAIQTGDTRWVQTTGLSDRGIIETCGSIASRLGLEGAANGAVNMMRPDGTWAFTNTARMREQAREFTSGVYDSLGEDGSTSLGTCVQNALPLIHYALLTGDQKFVPPCIAALNAMRRFRVPRGAQVWEVHQDIPDIRAAALAVEAYQAGYEITGDEGFLDEASYWAWTGVPFIYSWHVPTEDHVTGKLMSSRDREKPAATSIPFDACFEQPHRRITPYATIPVLGPTFYIIDWLGVPVQWCGLEWAWKVLELQRDRPDPLLRTLAIGVIGSSLQQMFDKAPWAGLYPDSWPLDSNAARNPLLSAWLPLECLQSTGRVPVWTRTWTRVVRGELGRPSWHVSGWGPPPVLAEPLAQPLRWSVLLRYPPGQLNELMVAHAEKPQRVIIETDLLNELSTKPAGLPQGWYYDGDRRVVIIRFKQPDTTASVRLKW